MREARRKDMYAIRWLIGFVPLAAFGCSSSGAADGPGGAGTGGSAGSTGGTAGAVPIEEFVDQYVAAACDHLGSCCSRGGYVFDAAACRSAMETYALAVAAGARAQPPTSTYDPAAAAACFALAAGRGERCVVEPLPNPNPCDRMFTGTVPAGAPCQSSSECAPVDDSSVTCTSSTTDSTLRCTPMTSARSYRRGSARGACSATCSQSALDGFVTCEGQSGAEPTACYTNDGLYCSEASECAALPSIGAPCGSGSYCADGAYCEAGSCVAQRATGPCESPDACLSTAYCADGTNECVAKDPDGASCSEAEQCASGGCNQSACGPALLASPENCYSPEE